MAISVVLASCGGEPSEERVVDYEGVPSVEELEAGGSAEDRPGSTTSAPDLDEDPAQRLRRAIGLTEVVTTGAFVVSEHLDGFGLLAEPMRLEGAFDGERGLVGVRADLGVALTPYGVPGMAAQDTGVDVDIIGEPGTTYVSGVAFGLGPQRWVRLSADAGLSDYADDLHVAARALDGFQPLLKPVGESSLGADDTFWYEGRFTTADLGADQQAALGQVLREMPLVAGTPVAVEVDVHVGEDGLLRQVRWYVEGIDLNPLVGLWEQGRFESTIDYLDLGQAPSIQVPGGLDVVDEADLPPIDIGPPGGTA